MANDDDDDDEIFALGSAFAGDLAAMAGGEHARLGVEADRKRRFESKVEAWARRHGLTVDERTVVATVDDARVTIALYEMTEETAVVRSIASAPARVAISAEPTTRSWIDSLRAKLRKKSALTGDGVFDERFYVRTSDDAALPQIFGEDARGTLVAIDAWCSVRYEDGKIELRLDSPRLSAGHLRRAIDVVAALTRARVSTTAYR